jgi:hypothetical protein
MHAVAEAIGQRTYGDTCTPSNTGSGDAPAARMPPTPHFRREHTRPMSGHGARRFCTAILSVGGVIRVDQYSTKLSSE